MCSGFRSRRSCVAKEARASRRRRAMLGALPVWDLSDLYRGMDAPEVKRDLERGAAMSAAFEARYKGKLAGARRSGPDGGAQARRGDRRIRADRGDPRPARQLCRPRLCRRHLRPGARQVLRRPAGPADHDLHAPPLLRAGAEPARRRAARGGARRRRRSPSTGRGSRICGWSGPTSSTTRSSGSSTRNR